MPIEKRKAKIEQIKFHCMNWMLFCADICCFYASLQLRATLCLSIYYRSELSALNLCIIFYGRTFSQHSFVTHSLSSKKGNFKSVRCFYGTLLHILNCTNQSNKTSGTEMNAMKRRWLKVDAENKRLHRRDEKEKQNWKILQFCTFEWKNVSEQQQQLMHPTMLAKSLTTQNKRETRGETLNWWTQDKSFWTKLFSHFFPLKFYLNDYTGWRTSNGNEKVQRKRNTKMTENHRSLDR